MKKHICKKCKKNFNEPHYKRTSYEDEYGVGSMFPNKTYLAIEICPYCKSDDIEEYEDKEYEGDEF